MKSFFKKYVFTACVLLELFSRIVSLLGYTTLSEYIGLFGAILAYVGAVIYSIEIIKAQIHDHKMAY